MSVDELLVVICEVEQQFVINIKLCMPHGCVFHSDGIQCTRYTVYKIYSVQGIQCTRYTVRKLRINVMANGVSWLLRL